jgi:hypothetical protein
MKLTLLAVIALLASTAQAQSPTIRVKDFMTAAEVKDSGIEKLSAAELAALDSWFARMSARIYQLGSSSASSDSIPSASLRSSSRPGASALVSFSSLEGATIIADDGVNRTRYPGGSNL